MLRAFQLQQGNPMKIIFRVLAFASAFIAGAAAAADLPLAVKAQPSSLFSAAYPYQTSGPIFGIYTAGTGGSVNATVPGVGAASLTTTTAEIGGTVGYAWGQKGSPIAYTIEGDFGFTNFNGNTAGLSLQGPLSFEQRVTIFTPFNNLVAMLPNLPNLFGTVPPFPPLQPGVTASNLQMGFAVGVKEKDISTSFIGLSANKVWRVEPALRLVAMEQLSNGSAIRAYVETAFPDKGKVFGPVPGASVVLGTEVTAGVGVMF
jgi:hypothetical protein